MGTSRLNQSELLFLPRDVELQACVLTQPLTAWIIMPELLPSSLASTLSAQIIKIRYARRGNSRSCEGLQNLFSWVIF